MTMISCPALMELTCVWFFTSPVPQAASTAQVSQLPQTLPNSSLPEWNLWSVYELVGFNRPGFLFWWLSEFHDLSDFCIWVDVFESLYLCRCFGNVELFVLESLFLSRRIVLASMCLSRCTCIDVLGFLLILEAPSSSSLLFTPLSSPTNAQTALWRLSETLLPSCEL